MKLSFDQTTDYSFRELHKFLKKASIPEYVKEASESTDYDSLPKEAFADPYNRAFPKHSKEDTYLSYVHFINKKASLKKKYSPAYVADVDSKLKKSAALFEITQDLENYTSSLNTKEASDYSEKTIYEADLNGQPYPLFTYKTAEELKLASEQYARDYKRIPFEWRKDICNNFIKAAKVEGLDDMPDIICKYAGMFYPDTDAVVNTLKFRADITKNAEHKEAYTKMADNVEGLIDNDDFMKVAETCYWMERNQGIYDNKNSSATYGDPVDRIFTLSIDKIAATLDVVKLGNDYYKMTDLQSVKPDIYKEAFGIDIDNTDTDSIRESLPTMPLSDVSLFRELSGVRPV